MAQNIISFTNKTLVLYVALFSIGKTSKKISMKMIKGWNLKKILSNVSLYNDKFDNWRWKTNKNGIVSVISMYTHLPIKNNSLMELILLEIQSKLHYSVCEYRINDPNTTSFVLYDFFLFDVFGQSIYVVGIFIPIDWFTVSECSYKWEFLNSVKDWISKLKLVDL